MGEWWQQLERKHGGVGDPRPIWENPRRKGEAVRVVAGKAEVNGDFGFTCKVKKPGEKNISQMTFW